MTNINILHFLNKKQQDFIINQESKKAKQAYVLAFNYQLQAGLLWRIPVLHTKKRQEQLQKMQNAKNELIKFVSKIRVIKNN